MMPCSGYFFIVEVIEQLVSTERAKFLLGAIILRDFHTNWATSYSIFSQGRPKWLKKCVASR